MGGLARRIPITFATMAVGTLAIAGVPPLSGFWSKDEIIWGAFAGPRAASDPRGHRLCRGRSDRVLHGTAHLPHLLRRLAGAIITRQQHLHESPAVMTVPLIDPRRAGGRRRISPDPAHRRAGHRRGARRARAARDLRRRHHARRRRARARLVLLRRASRPAGPRRERARGLLSPWSATSTASTSCTTASSTVRFLAMADAAAWVIDAKVIDGIVNGVGTFVFSTSGSWRRVQTGNVQHYALSFLVGAAGASSPTTWSDDAHRRRRLRRPLAGRAARGSRSW